MKKLLAICALPVCLATPTPRPDVGHVVLIEGQKYHGQVIGHISKHAIKQLNDGDCYRFKNYGEYGGPTFEDIPCAFENKGKKE